MVDKVAVLLVLLYYLPVLTQPTAPHSISHPTVYSCVELMLTASCNKQLKKGCFSLFGIFETMQDVRFCAVVKIHIVFCCVLEAVLVQIPAFYRNILLQFSS
jgi:hypothetical protein